MALITAKQANLFEVFYQRARILAPEKLAGLHRQQQHQDAHLQRERDAAAYAYGYDLPTLKRLAVIPVLPRPARCPRLPIRHLQPRGPQPLRLL